MGSLIVAEFWEREEFKRLGVTDGAKEGSKKGVRDGGITVIWGEDVGEGVSVGVGSSKGPASSAGKPGEGITEGVGVVVGFRSPTFAEDSAGKLVVGDDVGVGKSELPCEFSGTDPVILGDGDWAKASATLFVSRFITSKKRRKIRRIFF